MPGLLDLRTDLKSLKYGNDQPGNGSSGQPYIKTDINTVDRDFNRFRLTKFDDGFIRGGAIGALNASITDTLRIGKFLVDFPKGPLFIAKQIGLQLTNPRLESKQLPTDRPTTGGGFFNNIGNFISNTANRIENAVGPTRIYNLGINTLAQVPVNAFGGHIVRHGFTPNSDSSKYYEAVVTQNNINGTNRLVLLWDKFQKTNPLIIDQYTGGPNSVYGIGTTILHRAPTPKDNNIIGNYSSAQSGFPLVNGQRQTFLYIDPETYNGAISSGLGQRNKLSDWNKTRYIGGVAYKAVDQFGAFFDTPTDPNKIAEGVNQSVYNEGYVIPTSGKDKVIAEFYQDRKITDTPEYAISEKSGSIFAELGFKLDNLWPNNTPPLVSATYTADKTADIQQSKDKASNALTDAENENDIVANGPSTYSNILDPQLSGSFKYVDLSVPNISPIYANPALATYAELQRKLAPVLTPKQQITLDRTANDYKYNSGKLTYTEFNRTNDTNIDDDTLALRFTPINPFTGLKYDDAPLKFLAYITNYSDNFDSTWNDIKYVGRGESFYIFNGFKRSVNLGFNIPCYSQENLLIQHTKLNQLVSILAGDYTDSSKSPPGGLLGGIITRLTVGNYINNQPGIINNLTFEPIENSSWDLDKKLAFYIKVSFGFTVIHNFVPRYGKRFINVVTGSGGNEVIVDNPLKTTENDPSINIPAGQRGPGNTFVP